MGFRETSWTTGATSDAPAFAVARCVLFVGTPLKCPKIGRFLWQQPCATGITAFPHSAVICLQHAISAGVIRAPGREQAIAGATSGRHTAKIKAKWRTAFILCCHFDSTSVLVQSAFFLTSAKSPSHSLSPDISCRISTATVLLPLPPSAPAARDFHNWH